MVDLRSNSLALLVYQVAKYTFLITFGTHTFSSNKNVIEYISSLSNAREQQQAQLEVAKILRQPQVQVGK